jgi:cysteine desulfurase/selenocysteine lyase
MREPPVKKTLYWCDHCDVPLIGKQCGCGLLGRAISLLQPYDVRPALAHDKELITSLVFQRFGEITLPHVILLNKTGGLDRNDLVIIHGERLGWLSFDPVDRQFRFDIAPEGLPFILPNATRGIINLDSALSASGKWPSGRIGGKRFRVMTNEPEGTVIIQYGKRFGTGILKGGYLKVKEVGEVPPRKTKNPAWDLVVERNRYHLKNLERNAVRAIRQQMKDRACVNVSFSGGKDSTAVLALARKAGIIGSKSHFHHIQKSLINLPIFNEAFSSFLY